MKFISNFSFFNPFKQYLYALSRDVSYSSMAKIYIVSLWCHAFIYLLLFLFFSWLKMKINKIYIFQNENTLSGSGSISSWVNMSVKTLWEILTIFIFSKTFFEILLHQLIPLNWVAFVYKSLPLTFLALLFCCSRTKRNEKSIFNKCKHQIAWRLSLTIEHALITRINDNRRRFEVLLQR
jgi:hypothetical protein